MEEIVRTDKWGKEVQTKDFISPVPLRVRDYLPRVLPTYPLITSDKPANLSPNRYKACKWRPIGMKFIKEIK